MVSAYLSDTIMANRQESKATRLDLRIPGDVYTQVEEIAMANNEPSHHITGNIILTPTLIKLIRLGIRSLSDDYPSLSDLPSLSQLVPDTLTPRMNVVELELSELKQLVISLSDRLSDKLSDSIKDVRVGTLSGESSDNVPDPIMPDENILSAKLSDNMPDIIMADEESEDLNVLSMAEEDDKPLAVNTETENPPAGITIGELVKITRKTRQAIEKLRNDRRLITIGYKAEKVGRNWLYFPVTMQSKSM
jgi:hypothetical protein